MLRSLRMSGLLAVCALVGCAHQKNSAPPPPPPPPPAPEAIAMLGHPNAASVPQNNQEQLHAVVGTISGRVSDSTGAAVPGAVVTALGAGGVKQTVSDASGQFSIGGLAAGTYSLSVKHAGFATRTVDGVSVGAGEANAVNVVLPVGMEAAVMVSAAAPHRVRMARAPAPESVPDPVDAWFKDLQKGSIDYKVPGNMILNQSYTATATIHPHGAAPGSTPGGAGGGAATPSAGGAHAPVVVTHALPVSTWMRVVLSAPGNLDAFQIQQDPLPCKHVNMDDMDTQWSFTVKPVQGGKGKTLTFTAYAVYGKDASACAADNPQRVPIQIPADTVLVNVGDIDLHEITQSAWDKFWTDPWNYVKYVLPGGAGFAAIGKFVAWIRKKRDEEDGAPPPPDHAAG